MATIPSIEVPNPDAADVLRALERRWKATAIGFIGQAVYDALNGPQQARECIKAMIRVSVRNMRREEAEQAIIIPDMEPT
jgi:hypothetical protein